MSYVQNKSSSNFRNKDKDMIHVNLKEREDEKMFSNHNLIYKLLISLGVENFVPNRLSILCSVDT